MNKITLNRIKKEMEMLSYSPPAGVSCSASDDRLDLLSAQILGQEGTPFEKGIFHLEVQIPDRYPFDPPSVRFITPIYHPNIDTNGRICLDTLKLPPKGTWRPCLNISTVLMMIRILMAEPGSEDPLMTAIWQEYKYDYTTYVEKARQWTRIHAMDNATKKTSEEPSLESQNTAPSSTQSVLQIGTSDQQVSNLTITKAKQAMSLTTAADFNVDLSRSSIKLTKGLGLSNKRQALGESNTNAKVSKR